MPNVAGVEVRNAAEVAPLVEKQLQGLGVWSHPNDYTPVDGLVRAMRAAGSLAPDFARALVGLLGHGDGAVRAGAAAALAEESQHVSADDLARAMAADPSRFRGVKPPSGYPAADEDIESRLLVALGKSARSSHPHARQLLMDRARDGSLPALLGLARTDPDWLAANADVVPRSAIGGILRTVPGRAQRRAIVSALSPWPAGEGRALIQSKAWTLLPLDDDEKAELASLVTGTTGQP